jgi:hypothetical protein
MGERIESVDSEEFGRLFTSFRHTAYRLETLQVYDVGYEAEPMRRFLAGEAEPDDQAKSEWTAMVGDAVRDGKVIQRVHVVAEPVTDYLRYEMGCSYPPNVTAGEDIRILDTGTARSLAGLPALDYWLFDSRDLWVMEYGPGGEFLFTEHVTDPAEIVRHSYWRDAALHAAVPFRDYMNRMPGLQQALQAPA